MRTRRRQTRVIAGLMAAVLFLTLGTPLAVAQQRTSASVDVTELPSDNVAGVGADVADRLSQPAAVDSDIERLVGTTMRSLGKPTAAEPAAAAV